MSQSFPRECAKYAKTRSSRMCRTRGTKVARVRACRRSRHPGLAARGCQWRCAGGHKRGNSPAGPGRALGEGAPSANAGSRPSNDRPRQRAKIHHAAHWQGAVRARGPLPSPAGRIEPGRGYLQWGHWQPAGSEPHGLRPIRESASNASRLRTAVHLYRGTHRRALLDSVRACIKSNCPAVPTGRGKAVFKGRQSCRAA
jgi:hypothetical protein